MPIKHDVLIRFNLSASTAACVNAARMLNFGPELIYRILNAPDDISLSVARNELFVGILKRIISLKKIINLDSEDPVILEANFSENKSSIPADRELTVAHGVSHIIKMRMPSHAAVEKYFNHPEHLKLVAVFTKLAALDDSIFLRGGFAIPFDTEEPLTPRSVVNMVEKTGSTPFRNTEEAAAWAVLFLETYRADGVPHLSDLKTLVSVVSDIDSDCASAIKDAIKDADSESSSSIEP